MSYFRHKDLIKSIFEVTTVGVMSARGLWQSHAAVPDQLFGVTTVVLRNVLRAHATRTDSFMTIIHYAASILLEKRPRWHKSCRQNINVKGSCGKFFDKIDNWMDLGVRYSWPLLPAMGWYVGSSSLLQQMKRHPFSARIVSIWIYWLCRDSVCTRGVTSI